MSNFAATVIKALLASISTLTIILSVFLISLIFDMWAQGGMPPFENIKFSVSLFFVVILLLVICQCLKYHLYISIDGRDLKEKKQKKQTKTRADDVKI